MRTHTTKFELIPLLAARTASLAVGSSTARNQGAPGVVDAARAALSKVDLKKFSRASKERFIDTLDEHTEFIRRKLPFGARHWGTSRKCLNIFLRDILYNQFLCPHFGFLGLESFLEVPLDRDVACGLLSEPEGASLPSWRTIKSLDRDTSHNYQNVAVCVARRLQTHPIHLDVIYWRLQRSKPRAGRAL
jgi:hypothetical protein